MTDLTLINAVLGGVLIGLSASLLMLTTGRIAGISGFLSRLLPPYDDAEVWPRAAFIAGLALAPWLYRLAFSAEIPLSFTHNTAVLVIAGALVGGGAVLGSGCTSGHGVCGLARLSPRSLTATAIFMATAFLTVFVSRHIWGS